jgi:hypothetical protein
MNVNYNQHSHELVEPDLVEVEDFKVEDDEYDYEEHRRRVGGEVGVPIPLVVPLSVPEIVNKKQQERFPIVVRSLNSFCMFQCFQCFQTSPTLYFPPLSSLSAVFCILHSFLKKYHQKSQKNSVTHTHNTAYEND